jgi:hypothetical protein
MKELQE